MFEKKQAVVEYKIILNEARFRRHSSARESLISCHARVTGIWLTLDYADLNVYVCQASKWLMQRMGTPRKLIYFIY
jgi:hypothetical protein